MRWSSLLLMLGTMLTLVTFSGCGRADDAATSAPAGQVRIVSFSPAISRTLIDLELQEHIVGRTPFCESLDRSIPIVGDLLNIEYEQLLRLRPTHVLVQPPASGLDSHLVALAARNEWHVGSWRLDDVDDVKRMLVELPEVLDDIDVRMRAAELREKIDAALQPGDDSLWQGSTMLVAGVDPVGVFGTGTYLHDVLTALGASNAVTLANYPQLTLEDVTRLNPQAIILVRPGAAVDLKPMTALRSLRSLEIDAVRDGRVAVLSHPDAFMPSSGIVGVADEMRGVLRALSRAPRGSAP